MIRSLACALLLAAPAWAATPSALDPDACAPAIRAAESAHRLPSGLLGSIAMVESGRVDPRTGRAVAWPWTINVAGTGYYFATKAEAVAAVEATRAKGVQSIDVGCMQVNLMHHPNAFASLDDAFDPRTNAIYAGGFLSRLFAQSGSWPEAAASYHSQTPGLREDYQRRVLASWPSAARYGWRPAGPAKPVIDPLRQYTPEFRAQLAEDASDRAMRVALGLVRRNTRDAAAPPRSRVRIAGLASRIARD